MSPVCKMADNERLSVDQKVKVVFYAETKSVVVTQRRFRAHFGTRWAPCKQTIFRLSLGTIFQPMRINSVPDVKCFCNNKNVLCVQPMVWHFVRHPVLGKMNTNRLTDMILIKIPPPLYEVREVEESKKIAMWKQTAKEDREGESR